MPTCYPLVLHSNSTTLGVIGSILHMSNCVFKVSLVIKCAVFLTEGPALQYFSYCDSDTLTVANNLILLLSPPAAHNTWESFRRTEGWGQKFWDWKSMRESFFFFILQSLKYLEQTPDSMSVLHEQNVRIWTVPKHCLAQKESTSQPHYTGTLPGYC